MMDILFFVNDWYAWVIIYIIGYFVGLRQIVKALCTTNWRSKGRYELIKLEGDAGIAYFSSIFWPICLPAALTYIIFTAGTNGVYGESLYRIAPKPPKSIRKELAKKKLEEAEKEVGLI